MEKLVTTMQCNCKILDSSLVTCPPKAVPARKLGLECNRCSRNIAVAHEVADQHNIRG